jgi:hypothetical protein
MLELLLPMLSNLLPDVLKRVLPAEKMSEEERAKLSQDLTLEIMKADWQQVEAEYQDRNSARDLAKADIAKGNAFTGSLAAIVRPLWGIGAFVLIAWSVWAEKTISAPVQAITETVIMFYFGGRVVEKVTPHITGALGK